MRKIEELEGLTKEEMTAEEWEFKELVIDRIISIVLHLGFEDDKAKWSEQKTDKLLIFQEDIMKLCQYGAGFSLARSDDVRRAMGKKKMELMLSFRDEFVYGWQAHIGIFANEIWDKMVDYAKYCFNKSHAVAYTLITHKTAKLCTDDYKVDFMLYNFHYGKTEKKPAAINHLITEGDFKFPSMANPFGSQVLMINDEIINMNGIEGEEIPEEANKSYLNFADLFLADLPSSLKIKLILRGIYDVFTLDIKGLIALNKLIGKKVTIDDLPDGCFENKDLSGTLKVLKIKGLFDYFESTDSFTIKPLKTPRMRKDPEPFVIYKTNNLGVWSKETSIYRMTQLKKQFNVIKKNGLTPYYDRVPELREIGEKIDGILTKIQENNPNLKIANSNVDRVLSKVPKIKGRFDMLKDKIESEVFTGYVVDKKVLKNGTCLLVMNFSEDYTNYKFYTRSKDIIQDVDKGQVINMSVTINNTIWRGNYKVFTGVKLA